jgi:preprotein translocase subunit SecD
MFAVKNAVPLNRFPLWKYILIVLVVLLAVVYALPNIFGDSPAVQVSLKGGKDMTPDVVSQVQQILSSKHIPYQGVMVNPYNVELRFSNTDAQMQAQEQLQAVLGDNYNVAINLAANTPSWLTAIGANPMKYGLDLRGGMYFLLDVDMQTVIDNNLQNYAGQLRNDLQQQNIRYAGITVRQGQGIALLFRDPSVLASAEQFINGHYAGALVLSTNPKQPLTLYAQLSEQQIAQVRNDAVSQNIEVMRNRVNELGVAEASVAREGADRIVIELPGVQDAARAKEILGGTATLKVMLVNEQADPQAAVNGNIPLGSSLYYTPQNQPYVLYNRVVLTGDAVVGANSTINPETNLPAVAVKLSGPQVSYFSEVTRENVNHAMAIVLVQSTFNKQMVNGQEQTVTHTSQQIINVATINSPLGNNFIITGIGSSRAAQDLALTIRAGALAAPIQIVQQMQIGPTLGAENIKMGAISVAVAMVLVMLFMAIYYRVFGVVADIGLLLNLIFIVAVMSILPGATLTLPGIAGIVLNVGMAIDANVLIFERIREELRNNMSPQAAIHAGYQRAFATIVDSNVTTLIVAVILFAIGTGPVKGFAVTLMIGIVTSMFTAITATRGIVNLIYGGRQVKKLSIGI